MSQLERVFSHDEDGNPVMVIYKKQQAIKTFSLEHKKVEGYVIDLNDAWMYSRDHYPAKVPCFFGFNKQGMPVTGYRIMTYDQAMFAKCSELCHQFDLGLVTSQKMADIASMVEDGIGDLLSMPPRKEQEKHAIGEAEITVTDSEGGGFKKTVDV